MNIGDVQIREATPADKEAILNIRDDVYNGRDYLPAFYDNFMTSAFTTSFVLLYKGKAVSFTSATLIDGGTTVAARAGRVSKETEGAGFSRALRIHMEEWAMKRQIYRKVSVASENNLSDVTKPSFTKINKHLLTKEVLHYQLEPRKLKFPDIDIRTARDVAEVTDSQFTDYIRSKTASQYLFPKGRIVVNSVPYRVMEANIPLIREQKEATIIFSDAEFQNSPPRGIMSTGTIFPVTRPYYAYNLELYGTDLVSVRRHIVKHLLRLIEATTNENIAIIFVFVDETFPFDTVDKVFLDLGVERKPRIGVTKRFMFEKSLQPTSHY